MTSLDFRQLFAHPLILATFVLAFIGWPVAFIGQCVVQSKGMDAGGLWFAIFLQLFISLGLLYVFLADIVAPYRLQLSVFTGIAITFAVGGANIGLHGNTSSTSALGAGWLILAIVDILWLLLLTAEEGTFVSQVLNTGSTTSFSRRRTGTVRRPNLKSNEGNVEATLPPNPASPQDFSGPRYPNHTVSTTGSGNPFGNNSIGISSGGNHGISMTEFTPELEKGGQPHDGLLDNQPGSAEGIIKARALYSYNASADDPNELTFMKGDILDVLDNNGKWWQAVKADGTKGIVPSNYVALL